MCCLCFVQRGSACTRRESLYAVSLLHVPMTNARTAEVLLLHFASPLTIWIEILTACIERTSTLLDTLLRHCDVESNSYLLWTYCPSPSRVRTTSSCRQQRYQNRANKRQFFWSILCLLQHLLTLHALLRPCMVVFVLTKCIQDIVCAWFYYCERGVFISRLFSPRMRYLRCRTADAVILQLHLHPFVPLLPQAAAKNTRCGMHLLCSVLVFLFFLSICFFDL